MSLEASSSDSQLTGAIARAERRRAMLKALAEVGMALAKEIAVRFIDGPYHPEPKNDPGRGFAAASRAVRLTLMLEAKVDDHILALRKGDVASLEALKAELSPAPGAAPATAPSETDITSDAQRRDRIHDCVREAIEREIEDPCEARALLGTVYERMVEREDDGDFRFKDFRGQVEVLCAALGLQPDWSHWSDEDGFGRPEIPQFTVVSAWSDHLRSTPRGRPRDGPRDAPRLE